MSALLKLRDYQTEAIKDLHTRWDAGSVRVPLVLATGLGKTVIFAHVVADYVRTTALKRALVLVHTDELAQQAYKKIKDVAPDLHVGIVKAEQNQVTARVIVASVQTLRQAKRRAQLRNVGLIIVDECHHATASTYRAILEHFGAFSDHAFRSLNGDQFCVAQVGQLETGEMCGQTVTEHAVKVAGFTATLARGDKEKLSDVWEPCTFQRGISFGIRRGYLTDVRGIRVVVPDLDLTRVKKSGGDFQDGSLERELDRSLAPSIVATNYLEHAAERKAIGFAPTVASAEHFAEAFQEAGIPTAVIHGQLPREERRLILKKLHAGDIRVIWNCAVLTEGFDEPSISCVIAARPTKSAPLYQQMIGRGLRPDLTLPPDQRGDCLVLDVVGTSRDHTLRTLVDLSERQIREEIAEDDLSLLEMEIAEELAETEEDAEQAEEYYGETAVVAFDPLARTGIGAWLQTTGGTYFLPAGSGVYVLLVPSEENGGLWDVAWLTQNSSALRNGSAGDITEHRGLSLEMAVSWAEEVLEEIGGAGALSLADRRKRWRKGEPSEGQIYRAHRMGIELTGEESKGEVSDRISEAIASRRIDPIVAFMLAARS